MNVHGSLSPWQQCFLHRVGHWCPNLIMLYFLKVRKGVGTNPLTEENLQTSMSECILNFRKIWQEKCLMTSFSISYAVKNKQNGSISTKKTGKI